MKLGIVDMSAAETVKAVLEKKKQMLPRYTTRMILGLLLFAGGLTLSIWAYTGMMGSQGFKIPLTRTMHMSQNDRLHPMSHARSYFSLDWVMAPSTTHSAVYRSNLPGWTIDGESRMAPTPWQQESFCPTPLEKHAEWRDTMSLTDEKNMDLVEGMVMCDEDDGEHQMCARDVHGKIYYPNQAAYFVCRQSRVPDIMLYENDSNTWSLASSHSSRVLLFFMSIILWTLGLYEALRCHYVSFKLQIQIDKLEKMQSGDQQNQQEDSEKKDEMLGARANYLMAFLIFVGLGTLVWIVVTRFAMPTLDNFTIGSGEEDAQNTDGLWTGLHTRALPNGSFLYGLAAYLVVLWKCTSNLNDAALFRFGRLPVREIVAGIKGDTDDEQEFKTDADVVIASTKPEMRDAGKPDGSVAQMPGMNVSSFMSQKKISLSHYSVSVVGMPESTTKKLGGEPLLERINMVHKLGVSTWAVFQVAFLPLFVLCGLSLAQGFEIDIDIQLVFLSAFVLAAADVFVDRLLSVVHVCEVLEHNMLHGVQYVLLLLVVAVQTLLVVFINFVSGWRLFEDRGSVTVRNAVPEDSIGTIQMSYWALVLFNLYFAIISVIKIAKIYAHVNMKQDDAVDKRAKGVKVPHLDDKWFGYKALDETKLGILILFVFVYLFAVLGTMNRTQNYFQAQWNEYGNSATGMDREDIEILRWKGDWTMVMSAGVHA